MNHETNEIGEMVISNDEIILFYYMTNGNIQ